MMEPQSTNCDICGNKILSKCFEIHRIACTKAMTKSNRKITPSKFVNIELIPCSECGQMVAFSQYNQHIGQDCVGTKNSKCPQCKVHYPIFLFQEHLSVCQTIKEQEQQQIFVPESFDQKVSLQQQLIEQQDEDYQMDQMIMELAQNMQNQDQPLTLQMIEILKKTTTKKSEDCSICYCIVNANSQILKIHCNHVFHLRCMSVWLQKNPHCPMCRRYVLS